MSGIVHSLYDVRLLSGDYRPRTEAWYYRVWDGFDMSPHRHPRMEIMYVVSGSCAVTSSASAIRMQAGSLVLIDAGVPHGLRVPAGCPCRMMNLEFAFEPGFELLRPASLADSIPGLKDFLSPPRDIRFMNDAVDLHMRIRSLIDVLERRESRTPPDGAARGTAEVELHFYGLLVAMARQAEEEEGIDGGGRVPVHVKRALLFLRENYDRDIGLRETAAAAGVSAGHLARLFRGCTGESVIDRLSGIRMGHARRLLSGTDLPIGDIAGMVGFGSRHYFNAFFRDRCGCSPGAFRARDRHGAEAEHHDSLHPDEDDAPSPQSSG